MDQYVDSEAVVKRREELDARGADFARRNVDLRPQISATRTRAFLEFIVNKLGDRDEFELFYLDMLSDVYDVVEKELPAAMARSRLAIPGQ